MTETLGDQDAELMLLMTGECQDAGRRWPRPLRQCRRQYGRQYRRQWRRLLVPALIACGLAMIPWLAVLGWLLPATTTVPHWNTAWVGLDGLEALGLCATGWLMRRGDRHYTVTAAVTGTALLIDAWFDLLTAASPGDLLVAAAMAGLAELPLSGVCFFLALREWHRDLRGEMGARRVGFRSAEPGGDQGEDVVRQGVLRTA